MNHAPVWVEAVGWAAAVTILAAYLLLSMGKIDSQSRLYQWMNVAGAAGFIVNSGWNGALPSAGLNVVWALIGLVTLWRISRPQRTGSNGTDTDRR